MNKDEYSPCGTLSHEKRSTPHKYTYILHTQYNSVLESDTFTALLAGILHENQTL